MCFSFFYKHGRPQTEICYLTGMLSVNIQPNNQRKHVAVLNFKTLGVLIRVQKKWESNETGRNEDWVVCLDLGFRTFLTHLPSYQFDLSKLLTSVIFFPVSLLLLCSASVVSPGPTASPQEHLHHNRISNTQL